MCQVALPPTISRRRFLTLGAAAGVSALLTACRNTSGTGAFGRNPDTFSPLPPGSPSLAGPVAAAEDATLTIQAPVGAHTLARPATARLYDPNGDDLKRLPPEAGVLAWLEGGDPTAERIIALQQLPPLAATGDIPAELPAQPAPTGETRSLGRLTLITRPGWGAAPPQWSPAGEAPFDAQTNPAGYLTYPEPLAPWLTTLVVHHAALEFHHGPRTIQRLHILRKGYADVAYHFFIDGLGQLYEGRPLAARGAHTGGYNTGTVGVCLLGNFELIPSLQAQLDTLQALASTLGREYALTHLAGHRDFQPEATVCPGENLWSALPAVAAASGLAYGTAGYRPPPW